MGTGNKTKLNSSVRAFESAFFSNIRGPELPSGNNPLPPWRRQKRTDVGEEAVRGEPRGGLSLEEVSYRSGYRGSEDVGSLGAHDEVGLGGTREEQRLENRSRHDARRRHIGG